MKSFIGIDPETSLVVMSAQADPDVLADAFEKGLIIVPATEDDCREMYGEVVDLYDLCQTAWQASQ